MRIAMIGLKGVPATHGGVERHVEELGARLVERGHEVTVFVRPNYVRSHKNEHRGMRLVTVPTIGTKHLDAIVHSVLASLATWGAGYDVVHYHAIGPCLASPIARLAGGGVVATIHGQDWRRAKWGRAASMVLRLAEWMALHVPHVTVCVSRVLARQYSDRIGREIVFIPNGITIDQADDASVLSDFGLRDGGYILFAGRLVPEKGAHHLLAAVGATGIGMQVVIAGGSSNSDDYVARLRRSAGADVVFTGYQYDGRLAALFRHAALFVLPSDLEGLPIVLLEALAYGVPVVASDIPPNVEVLGDRGVYFAAGSPEDLRARLLGAIEQLDEMRLRARQLRQHAVADYDWERIACQTEQVYSIARRASRRAGSSSPTGPDPLPDHCEDRT